MDLYTDSTAPDPSGLGALIAPLAKRYGWRLVVLFGSVAREGRGRDLDLAVLPVHVPNLLEQGRWQSDLESLGLGPVDLLVLGPATSPLTAFEVMRYGRPLYELETGLFDREHDRAFFLYADTQWLRDRARETLYGQG
jgi:predicted nucleotidyltransferase